MSDYDELLAEAKRACVAIHCAIDESTAKAIDSLIRDLLDALRDMQADKERFAEWANRIVDKNFHVSSEGAKDIKILEQAEEVTRLQSQLDEASGEMCKRDSDDPFFHKFAGFRVLQDDKQAQSRQASN